MDILNNCFESLSLAWQFALLASFLPDTV